MTTLDRYLGLRLLTTLLKTLVALVLIYILVDLLTLRRSEIAKYDVPWLVVLRYYLAFTPLILCKYQIAALAILVSSLLVLGTAAQDNEVTAALSGGISLWRLVRMPVVLAAALAAALLVMEETVGAPGARQAAELSDRYFSSMKSQRAGVTWPRLQGEWTCHIMKFNRVALTGENILMHSTRADSMEQIQAKRIFWDPERRQWILEDGGWYRFPPQEVQIEVQRIKQCAAPIRETPEQLFALDQPPEEKTIAQLSGDIARARTLNVPVGKNVTDLHAKFSRPLLSFVMIWLAIPFAVRLRRGGLAIGFGVSAALGVAYMIVSRVSMGLGHYDHLNPVAAAWLANVMFLALGVVLFRKTAA